MEEANCIHICKLPHLPSSFLRWLVGVVEGKMGFFVWCKIKELKNGE